MRAIEHICLIIVTAAVAFAVVQVGLLTRDLRKESAAVAKQAQATLLDYSRFSQDATGVTAELRSTLKAIKASNEQTARNAAQSTATLNADLVKFGKVLDQISYTAENTDIAESALAEQASNTLADTQQALHDLDPAINNFVRASAGAADVMNDSNIHATIANLAQISYSTAGTSAEIEGTAKDIHAFVHRETTPVRGTWNVIKAFLREFAGPAAQVVTAVK